MMSRRAVKMTSGTSANGIPNESTTCEMTSVRDGSIPIAITTNAGSIVTSRRTASGIWRLMKPCITTWPESVPTAELDRPDASSASANNTLDAPPRIGSSVLCAPFERVDVEEALWKNVDAAITSIATLISPAIDIAMIDVDPRVAEERLRVLVRLGDDAVLRQRRVQVDHVRHHRRAEDADREQYRLAARRTAGTIACLATAPKSGCANDELGDIAGADHADERGDHGLEGPKPQPLQPEDRERRDRGEHRRREQADAEQQVEPDRGAEELGEVGRHRDRLRLDPEQERGAARAAARGRPPAGSCRVAIPSFADSVWISIARRFEATITQTSGSRTASRRRCSSRSCPGRCRRRRR